MGIQTTLPAWKGTGLVRARWEWVIALRSAVNPRMLARVARTFGDVKIDFKIAAAQKSFRVRNPL
jgi:hypothetical protein